MVEYRQENGEAVTSPIKTKPVTEMLDVFIILSQNYRDVKRSFLYEAWHFLYVKKGTYA